VTILQITTEKTPAHGAKIGLFDDGTL